MKNILSILMLLVTFCVYSQEKNELEIKWKKTYGGKKNEMVNSIIPSKNGAIIIGSKQPEDRYDVDLLVIKISSNGEIIWEKTYGDKKLENGYSGIELETGEIYILGTVTKDSKGSDIFVHKLSVEGELEWTKEFGSVNNEVAGKIIIDRNKDLVITGMQEERDETNNLVSKAFILKLDLDGNKKWMKNYVSDGPLTPKQNSHINDQGEGSETIQECKSGGYIIGGYSLTRANKGLATDGWICKVDSEGKKLWDKSFGTIGGDNVLTIIEDEEENIVVTGTRYNKTPIFKVSLWFLKFTAGGNLIIEQYYNQGNKCIGGESIKLSKDRFIIVGASNNTKKEIIRKNKISQQERDKLIAKGWEKIMYGDNEYLENDNSKTGIKRIDENYYIILVNNRGDELWDYVYGGDEDDKLTSICKTEKEEVYAAGYTYSEGNGLKDIVIFKLE